MQTMLLGKNGQQKSLSEIQAETVTDIRFSLQTIQNRTERLLDFVDKYRRLTRVPKPVCKSIACASLIEATLHLMRDPLVQNNIQTQIDVPADVMIDADPSLIEQVLINLVTNSIQALEHSPEKFIRFHAFAHEHGVTLDIADTGQGIAEKALQEIFIPFFSTKKEGSGIGLSLSKQIMSLHGGRIRVKSTSSQGTVFSLTFRKA